MTKAEAIRILEQSCTKRPQKLWSIKRKEAVKMAIEALQRGLENVNADSCSESPNRSDTIYRQDAVDALSIYGDKLTLDNVAERIYGLPSAQPEPCGDVVSRNAIVQKLNEMDRYVSTELRLCDTDKKFPQNEVFIVDDVYEEIVEQLPSAQPETCEGCKHLGKWENEFENGYPSPCTCCKRRASDHYER